MSLSYIKLIFTFYFLATNLLLAQQPVSIHLTEKDGLPDKEFYDIIEDDDGVIWLAADKGLFKYDGISYTSFTHPDQVGLSAFQLQKDADNVIWFTNIANQVFYVKNDTVTLFGDFKKDFKGILTTMLIYKEFLVLLVRNKLMIINRNTTEVLFEQGIKKSKNSLYQLYIIEPTIINNELYFGDNYNNFYTVNLKDFSISYKEMGVVFNEEKSSYNMSTSINFNEHIIYHTNFFGVKNKRKQFYSVPSNFSSKPIKLNTVFPDVTIASVQMFNNQLWYCTDNGVYICEVLNNELKIVQQLFENKFITSVVHDANKNYWFTTLKEGVYVVPNIEVNTVYTSLNKDRISKLFLGDTHDLLLTSSEKKLIKINVQRKKIGTLHFPENEKLHYIKYNRFNNQYYLYLKSKVQVLDQNLNVKRNSPQAASTKKIDFINENNFIIASSNRIIKAKIINSKIKITFTKDIRGYTCLYNSKNKQSYFGTLEGLYSYDESWGKKEIQHLEKPIYVNDITQTTDGRLWCSSFKNGIYVVENNTVIKHYTTDNGLLSNKNSFITSKENTIWLAGERGIQKFNTTTGVFQNLTKQDGIPSYNFNGLEIIDSKIYASTPEEVFCFDAKKAFKIKKKLNPYFTAISISEEQQKIQDQYTLTHDHNKLRIAFNTNGFLTKNNVQYQYRLLGSDNVWINNPIGINQVIYNSLEQGKYTFQLRAINGKVISEIKQLKLVVKGVFYKQWWFFLLLSLGVITFIWKYFSTKNNRLKETQKLLLEKQGKELENVFLKLESLRSQMNPHFIFNALNSIQDYIIHNEQKLARTFLVKFSRLIRMYLEHSQKDTISLTEELTALNFYLELEKDRFEDTLNYTIELFNIKKAENIQIPTFLIQPYIENALKHGLLHKKDNRVLTVQFTLNQTKTQLYCSIKDNGIGRVASEKINQKRFKPHKSFSSAANEKRINLLNKTRKKPIHLNMKDQYNDIGNPTGTIVTIDIPIV